MTELSISFATIFERLAIDCDLDKNTVQYCLRRLRAEGLKFWTITLPKLAKSILKSIELGVFDPKRDGLTDFAWKGRSLRYFRSLLGSIFSLSTGELLPTPSATSLRSLRQLLEYSYKLALDFEEKVLETAKSNYVQTQERVANLEFNFQKLEKLRKFAETNYPSLFKASPDHILSYGPRFGPGSVILPAGTKLPYYVWKSQSDRLIGTASYSARAYSGYFKPYPSSPTRIVLKPDAEKVAKILFVPKDSRGPRVISKEQPHTIRAQMAFFKWCSATLAKQTSGRIQFLDQSINRRLACESSITRENATLDLKEASDSVSIRHIRYVFRNAPGVSWFLRNFRATHYQLPNTHGTALMSCLAGMGSGLTFPLLSFWIHLLACFGVCSTHRLPFKAVSLKVRTFGDDLIVPDQWVDTVTKTLHDFGMEVNTSKSYRNSNFRESCGGDYFHGTECAPTRLRLNNSGLPVKTERLSSLSLRASECTSKSNLIVSLVAHARELRIAGYYETASYFEDRLSQVIPMPYVGLGSPVLGIYTEDTDKILSQGTYSSKLCTTVVKGVISTPIQHTEFVKGTEPCPYKYLGVKLKTLTKTTLGSDGGTTYGGLPIPRRLKLKFGNHSTSELLPVVKYPDISVLSTKRFHNSEPELEFISKVIYLISVLR
jgi:hypothetical protein